MNEFSTEITCSSTKTLRKGIEEYKIKHLLVRYFVGERALRVELLSYGKSRRNGQHEIGCTYRRLEFIFTERHLESCSNEPAAMKQVMAPEVRENSIPSFTKRTGPAFHL